jgi:thiamine biosynthesis lipoprotein
VVKNVPTSADEFNGEGSLIDEPSVSGCALLTRPWRIDAKPSDAPPLRSRDGRDGKCLEFRWRRIGAGPAGSERRRGRDIDPRGPRLDGEHRGRLRGEHRGRCSTKNLDTAVRFRGLVAIDDLQHNAGNNSDDRRPNPGDGRASDERCANYRSACDDRSSEHRGGDYDGADYDGADYGRSDNDANNHGSAVQPSADDHDRHEYINSQHDSAAAYRGQLMNPHVELRLHEATFRAFGSSCRIVSDVESAVVSAIHRLEDIEERWSRFLPSSEVSAINANAGGWVEVSSLTIHLVRRAIEASERTAGVVNPLLLRHLIALGYDRSNEGLVASSDPVMCHEGSAISHRASDIEVDGGAVKIPQNVSFDPGGVGKGLAADIVMEDVLAGGATWAMVSLGGDMRFGGCSLAERGWGVQVEDPIDRSAVAGVVDVTNGAIASSSTRSRRWIHEGRTNHHLLDPTIGEPAISPRHATTVWAESAWWADVVAKTLIIDPRIGREQLDDWNALAVAFTDDGIENLGLRLDHPK